MTDTMDITSLLSADMVLCQHDASSKKRILEDIAEHIGKRYPDTPANTIFSALIAREKLGSTGIGNGIAIPHCRIGNCKQIMAMLISLNQAIDFDAIDNQAVDIVFALIVPEEDNDSHLKTLANIAQTFSNKDLLNTIRNATKNTELLEAISIQ